MKSNNVVHIHYIMVKLSAAKKSARTGVVGWNYLRKNHFDQISLELRNDLMIHYRNKFPPLSLFKNYQVKGHLSFISTIGRECVGIVFPRGEGGLIISVAIVL